MEEEERPRQTPAQAPPPASEAPTKPSELARSRKVVPLHPEMTPEQAGKDSRFLREEVLVPARQRERAAEERCAALTPALYERYQRLIVALKTDATGQERTLASLGIEAPETLDEAPFTREGSWLLYDKTRHVIEVVTTVPGFREAVKREVSETSM